jgi:hypothetical protein
MTEKSGIEIIKEIQEKITLLEKRFTNIEFMMKELLNRSNVGEKPAQIKPTISATEIKKTVVVPQSIAVTKTIERQPVKIGDFPAGPAASSPNSKTKIIGQIKNKDGRFVSGVSVKIFDANKQMIKETRSNKSGEWMSLLPSGKYRAELYLENMIDGVVEFSALPGQTLVRVAQPIQKEV